MYCTVLRLISGDPALLPRQDLRRLEARRFHNIKPKLTFVFDS